MSNPDQGTASGSWRASSRTLSVEMQWGCYISSSRSAPGRPMRARRSSEDHWAMGASPWAERLCERYFGDSIHPYATFENTVRRYVRGDLTLLDAGCGHGAPVLRKFLGSAKDLIGVDLIDFDGDIPGVK